MNSLIKSATIIDKKSDFHNAKVDILIGKNDKNTHPKFSEQYYDLDTGEKSIEDCVM